MVRVRTQNVSLPETPSSRRSYYLIIYSVYIGATKKSWYTPAGVNGLGQMSNAQKERAQVPVAILFAKKKEK